MQPLIVIGATAQLIDIPNNNYVIANKNDSAHFLLYLVTAIKRETKLIKDFENYHSQYSLKRRIRET